MTNAGGQSGPTGAGSSFKSSYLAWAAIGTMGLIHGYNWVVMKSGLRFTDPATFAALRTFLGAVLLFIFLFVLRRPLRPPNLLLTLIVGLFSMMGTTGLSMWALEHGQAGKTSVLVYTMPMWVLLMAWVILGERIRGIQWIFVAAALAGMLLVISPWNATGSLFSNLLGVAAGICSAISVIAAKLLCRDLRVDLLNMNAWQMLFGSIPIVIIALFVADGSTQWTGWFVAALLYNVILASPVALLLWFYSLRHLPAGTAGLGRLTAPTIGVLASWIQLGERPDIYEATGMILIIASLACLAWSQIAAERRQMEVVANEP